jgi:predicted membrane protein
MDSKTKFLVSIVALGAAYAIGMSYYKYIVMKDIDLHYTEEKGEETDEKGLEEESVEVNESEAETDEVMRATSSEEDTMGGQVIESGIDVQATSSGVTAVSE